MKPSIALEQNRRAVREATRRFRATNPRIFGSVLHGDDQDGSDLDVLVDPLPGATLFDLGGLQVELEELLGVPVDLLTPADLPPTLRSQVLAEFWPSLARRTEHVHDDRAPEFQYELSPDILAMTQVFSCQEPSRHLRGHDDSAT